LPVQVEGGVVAVIFLIVESEHYSLGIAAQLAGVARPVV
jgi:hypothetical protein